MGMRGVQWILLALLASQPACALYARGSHMRLRGGTTAATTILGPHRTRTAPCARPDSSMSDAERVYVVQAFSRSEVRKRFLTQVFAIIAAQLATTAGVMAAVRALPALLFFMARAAPLFLFAPLLPAFLLQMLLSTGENSSMQYVLLSVYTILQALALGLATAALPGQLVLNAAGATTVAVGSLSVYALTTKRDFTVHGGMLAAGVTALLALSIIQFFVKGSWVLLGRSYFGVLLFSGWLVYDLQQMMGGNKKEQARPNEPVKAAFSIFVDLVNIFVNILQLMAANERRRD